VLGYIRVCAEAGFMERVQQMSVSRRKVLIGASGLVAASAAGAAGITTDATEAPRRNPQPANGVSDGETISTTKQRGRVFNGPYRDDYLNQIAFPLGGIGAGSICVEGSGALTKFSLHNRPELSTEPQIFAAIAVKGSQTTARVLEGPLPKWKLRPSFVAPLYEPAMGPWGLPRFRETAFQVQFPFARVRLHDPCLPLVAELAAWSPFSPPDADDASLPVACLEYDLRNNSANTLDAVFSFNCTNLMAAPPDPDSWPPPKSSDRVLPTRGGVILYGPGANATEEGRFAVWTDDRSVLVNHAWFRGRLASDTLQMVWNDIATGKCYERAPLLDASVPGATLFVPFTLARGDSKTVRIHLAWYVPRSDVFWPDLLVTDGQLKSIKPATQSYQPWYSARFADIEAVKAYWSAQCSRLRAAAETFSNTFYDSTLPPEVLEAVAANLAILKSPTVLRQTDGRIWAWEGVADENAAYGGGPGNCNHVWNYAQSMPHLFPALERTLRETEFGDDLGRDGFQAPRAALPIRPIGDTPEGRSWPAAADGQPGTIIRVYRDWRISGDTSWLRTLWPNVRSAMDYCTATWDPDREGWLKERHFTTYDVFFWGPDSLCTSLYLGALKAVIAMGTVLDKDVLADRELLRRGLERIESELFNGEYFYQQVEWKHLRTPFPPPKGATVFDVEEMNADYLALTQTEGPPYQYGRGCLADGVLGAWACFAAGLGELLDRNKVQSHLLAVYRYNLKASLFDHPNTGRPYLGCGDEAGLLLCSWPNGQRPSLPMLYADEVWTGVEYQVASHLIALGKLDEGLAIVRACRARYDGRTRNPFDEIEAGHFYARAMSSYALLQACSGARFDAVERVVYLQPTIKGDFRSFLATATGYGTVGVRAGKPFVEVVAGDIPFDRIEFHAD
jgi:uncharacterized protein (DUF608 family)